MHKLIYWLHYLETVKCISCGRDFESGATIYRGNVYCPDCSRELDLIIDEAESRVLEAILEGKPIPDVLEILEPKREVLRKLRLDPVSIKRDVLSRVASATRLMR
jgi:predicted RNA-binding Zn-ribbon protein involved in translation (DUF1610 family)